MLRTTKTKKFAASSQDDHSPANQASLCDSAWILDVPMINNRNQMFRSGL
ncbi:unnamed protein product [Rhodiola kirilowii]